MTGGVPSEVFPLQRIEIEPSTGRRRHLLLPYLLPLALTVGIAAGGQPAPRPSAHGLVAEAATRTRAAVPSPVAPGETRPETTHDSSSSVPATVAPRPQSGRAEGGVRDGDGAEPRLVPASTTSGTWAVIVGINDYAGTGDLHFAEADASDMAQALVGLGTPADHIRHLAGAAATGPGVRAALDWLVAEADPEALAVVFFAGHVRREGASAESLRLADGELLSDAELASRLQGLRARRAWITVAACFGGGFVEVLAPGRVLTAAAPASEKAYETTEYDRSFLVQFMVREALIEGRSAPTVQDAFAYAAARPRHEFRPVQFEMDAPRIDLRS